MSIINTEHLNDKTTFEQALLNSLPSLNGLWFPEKLEKLPPSFFDNIENLSYNEIAFIVLKNITEYELDDNQLKKIIKKAFNFPVKLQSLGDTTHVLETFHGPTYTFKDFGARFLACYLEEYLMNSTEKYNVLVSTSGDTGSAIASAFHKIPNIQVTILYPKNRVSKIQEIQMATYGGNIVAYCIENNFDQCQSMVKRAFVDKGIRTKLISANSINLGRLLPQSIYYFYAYGLLKKKYGNGVRNNVVFSVPCGNCGNLTGGLIAKKMGLPVKFIASQNTNSVFVDYINSGEYLSIISTKTFSNAMDVGDPSNVKRIDYIYDNNIESMKKDVYTHVCNEHSTMITMKKIWEKYNYVADPHTAVAFDGIYNYKSDNNGVGDDQSTHFVAISTASPVKFRYTISTALGIFPKLTDELKFLNEKPKYSISLKNCYTTFINNISKSMNANCSVTLIGMPGTGKSTVSAYINEVSTKYELIDLDKLIESKNKGTMFELIDILGEKGFSELEEKALLSIDFNSTKIIATGGSVVYSKKGMEHLQNKNNLIVYLKTPYSILAKRTDNFTNRGIVFNGLTPNELYNERRVLYEKYADITIDSEKLYINDIGNIILEYFAINL